MASSSPLRTTILATRVCATLFAAAGLALYTVIMIKIMHPDFPATLEGLTALPLAGAATSVAWNLIIFATVRHISPLWCAGGDLLIFIILSVFGSIGLVHDDRSYLSNGLHFEYNQDPWLYEEITGASLLLVSVLLQLALAFLNIFAYKQRNASQGDPPPYYGKEQMKAGGEEDGKSFASFESYDVVVVPKAKRGKEEKRG